MSAAQADRIAKQSRYEMASSSPPGALPDVLDDLSLKDSQKSLADLQAKLAQLTVTFTANHAEVKRVQAQITAIETSLNASRTNIVTRIRKEYEAAQRRESLLATAYAEQARLVSAKAEETAHYSLLKRDVDATRLLYDSLLQRLKEASIASALRANNIRVVDARRAAGTSRTSRTCASRPAVGLLFGLVMGVAFAVFRERADRTLQDPGDVSYYLGAAGARRRPRVRSAGVAARQAAEGRGGPSAAAPATSRRRASNWSRGTRRRRCWLNRSERR